MVLVVNFSNNRRGIPKKMVVRYATHNPTLIIPLNPDSYLIAHFHESFGLDPRSQTDFSSARTHLDPGRISPRSTGFCKVRTP